MSQQPTPASPRQPQQTRSRERVARILAATADLLREVDYAAINVQMIAERAGTSVGSLYQFFANKDAVLSALAERYAAELDVALTTLFASDEVAVSHTLQSKIEHVVDAMVAFTLEHPGFLHITRAEWVSEQVSAAITRMDNQIMGGLMLLLNASAPAPLDDDSLYAAAKILYSAVGGILPYIEAAQGEARERLLTQLKRVLVGGAQAVIQPVQHPPGN